MVYSVDGFKTIWSKSKAFNPHFNLQALNQDNSNLLGMVAHAINLSTLEALMGRSLWVWDSLVYIERVPSQSEGYIVRSHLKKYNKTSPQINSKSFIILHAPRNLVLFIFIL